MSSKRAKVVAVAVDNALWRIIHGHARLLLYYRADNLLLSVGAQIKTPCRSFARFSAWWRTVSCAVLEVVAVARIMRFGASSTATLDFCSTTAQTIFCYQSGHG